MNSLIAMPPSLPRLPGVEHRYHALSTGVRAHVAHAGPADAPAVVALHGWPQHWYCWRRVIPLLADDRRVLAMDLRGLGWSGRPADGDYRKARMAEDAVALLDDLELERACLLAHDWGGFAGFLAALRAPERWTGFVAVGVAHPWQPPRRVARNLYRLAYQPLLGAPVAGPWLMRATPLVERAIRLGTADRSGLDDDAVESFAASYRDPERAEAGSRLYRDFLAREAKESYAGQRLRVPTRLLVGTRDSVIAPFAPGLERHADDSTTEFLEGCGHFVPEERPAEVAAAVRAVCG